MRAHLGGKQCQCHTDDISLTDRVQLWTSAEPKSEDLNAKCLTCQSEWIYPQRSPFSAKDGARENNFFLNASCLKSSRALQHAAGLQHADLHLITRTSLPSWGPTGCWLGRFPRSGGGPRSCGEVMCPMPSTVNESILKDRGGVRGSAESSRWKGLTPSSKNGPDVLCVFILCLRWRLKGGWRCGGGRGGGGVLYFDGLETCQLTWALVSKIPAL